MRHKAIALLLVFLFGLLSFGVASAQDATEEPVPAAEPLAPNTLEDVTANHASYYGQAVTIDGYIQDLLNVRTFVLGENAALDDDKVLVINNSGQEFDLNVRRDRHVIVTGVVWPSIEEGGLGQITSGTLTSTVEPFPPSTEDLSAGDLGAALPTEDMSGAAMPTEEQSDMMGTEEPDMMATEDMGDAMATATPMPSMTSSIDLTQMVLPDEFNNYTIIVIDSLDSISYIEDQAPVG